ncbi:MAG: Gfo/Idh/MocA family protein [Betaproteobacteria bacterium]
MEPLRIAVVGTGQIGRRHIEMIRRLSGVLKLVAIVDPAPGTEDYALALGVRRAESLESMLSQHRPDGVVIASPNHLHESQALACIDAGIPALVEKPMAHSLKAARAIASAAQASGVPILVGHHRRHSAIMAEVASHLASGALGRLVGVSGTTLYYKADNEGYYEGAGRWRREPGGGPILINMIHEVDNLRALCGEIVSTSALSSNAVRDFAVEDTAAMLLRFSNGVLGCFLLSDAAASNRNWEHTSGEDPRFDPGHSDHDDCYVIAGTMGSLAVPTMRLWRYPDEAHRSWHRPLLQSAHPFVRHDPLERQMAHFAEVLRGRVQPLVSAYDGMRNLQVIDAMLESIRSGKTVDIAD